MEGRGKREEGRGRLTQLLLLPFFLFPLPSHAQRPLRGNPVPPLLRRAIQASKTARYTGRRTVTVLKEGQAARHEEIVVRDGPRVRIEFPREGGYAGQVIVEDGGQRRHFIPRTNEIRVLPPRQEEGLQRLRALARSGNVATEPGDRIAGYATRVLVVRDAVGNPLQRIAVEPDSGIVLGRQVYDATGVQVGGFVFTKIDLNPGSFDPALFRIERKGVRTSTPWQTLARLAARSGYRPNGLPESTGFRLDGASLRRLPSGDALVQNYSGPGGRLTLVQLRAAVDPASLRRQGGRRLRSLSWNERGVTWVLLGPQDDATLARLRDEVGPPPPSPPEERGRG